MSYGLPMWPTLDHHDGGHQYLHTVAAFPGVALPYILPDLKSKRLTREHTSYLESQFQSCAKPNTNVKRSIAVHLGVSVEKINNWFQNRRAKHKQDLKKQAQQDANLSKSAGNPGDSPQEPGQYGFSSSSASSLPSAASSPPTTLDRADFPYIKQEMSMSPDSPTLPLETPTLPDVADVKGPLTPAMTPAIEAPTPMTTMSMPAISLEQYNMPTVNIQMTMPSWIDAQSPDLAATLDIMPPSDAGLAISLEEQAMAHAVGFAASLDPGTDRIFHRRVSSTSSLTESVEDMLNQTFGQFKAPAPHHSAPTIANRRRKRVPKPLNVTAGRVVKCGLPSGQQSPALTLGLSNWQLGPPDDLPTPLTPLSATTYHSAAASSSGLTSAIGACYPWTSPPMTPLNGDDHAFVPFGAAHEHQHQHQQHQQQHQPPSQQEQQTPQYRFFSSGPPPQSAPATQLAFPPASMPELPAAPSLVDSRHLRRPSLPNAPPAQPCVDRGLWLDFSAPMSAMSMDIPNGFTY